MELTRRRLISEVLGAGVIGLAPWAFEVLEDVVSASASVPHFVIRTLHVVTFVTGPGCLVGAALVNLVCGFYTTNLRLLDQLALRVGLTINVVTLAALWYMARTGSRQSLRWKLATALIVVWVVFSVPFGVFASMWTVF